MLGIARFAVLTVRKVLYLAVSGLVGAAAVGVAVYIYILESRPDLRLWHLAELESEYSARRNKDMESLDAYRRLEDRLYQELEDKVRSALGPADRTRYNRYQPGSHVDPENLPFNWNRSFELTAEPARAGALMIHGLSDSPYSMRSLAEWLNEHGVWVVALRVPGHGTAPSGLVDVSWKDFKAATRLGARHVRERTGPNAPLFVFGYSNGAALAVEYALATLEGEDLPTVDRIVMLSPAIAVTKLARFAVWQGKLGHWLGLDKLAWNSIQPEFDPFKYNSFAVNAGDQIYRLTQSIAAQIARLDGGEGVEGMPAMLAIQSLADATTSVTGLVDQLYNRMAAGPHELLFFDINRLADTHVFISLAQDQLGRQLLARDDLPYDFSLVTNASADGPGLVEWRRRVGETRASVRELAMSWPESTYSLSHVALPFAADDPVYGVTDEIDAIVQVGDLELRGERGLLRVPIEQLVRLRYNPFFFYMTERIAEFLGLEPEIAADRQPASLELANAPSASVDPGPPRPEKVNGRLER